MKRIALFWITVAGSGTLMAQGDYRSPIDGGFTPAALAAGTPQGVSLLSPHEAVNLFNGNLSFTVPVHQIGGRGNAGYTMVLPIGAKWNIENHSTNNQNVYAAIGNQYPLELLFPSTGIARYTPGMMVRRSAVDYTAGTVKCTTANTPGTGYTYYYGQTLTRLTWIEADGTEHEFYDLQNGGAQKPSSSPATYTCQTDPINGGPNRGTVFVSDDATAATFISDTAITDSIVSAGSKPRADGSGVSGWLLFKDGTRYQFSNGNVVRIEDRNGNYSTICYTCSPLTITDNLGRVTSVSYASFSGSGPVLETVTYPGAPAANGSTQMHAITVTYDSLANHLRADFAAAGAVAFSTLFPNISNEGTYNPYVLASVQLPDGSTYTFQYNPYGELARANLPAGGAYEYDYPSGTDASCSAASQACLVNYTSGTDTSQLGAYRRVTARRVYPIGGSTPESVTSYSANGSVVSVTYSDASGEKHTFFSTPNANVGMSPPSQWYENGLDSREVSASWNDSTNAVLQSTAATWQDTTPSPASDGNGLNAVQCQALTTLGSGTTAATSGTFTLYDQYYNVSDSYQYAFGSAPAPAAACPTPVPAGWTRHSTTTYMTTGYDVVSSSVTGPTSNHMRDLILEQDIYSTTAMQAKTTYAYDGSSLAIPPGTPGGYSTPSHSYRGNLTGKTTWQNSSASWTATFGYDGLGNVITIKEPRTDVTITTGISYADNCTTGPGGTLDAFPTSVTNALNQTVTISYDCNIGKQTQFTDADGIITGYSYTGDPFDRLVLGNRARGTPAENHVNIQYPNLLTTIVQQDQTALNDTTPIKTTTLYDGLGRQVESRRALGSNYISVGQTYDNKDRPWKRSLPYNAGAGETAHFATTTYDAANRVIGIATDDGSKTTTGYTGNQTTVTDAAGASRTSTADGLGRIVTVLEDPGASPHANYQTSYAYDALDDLTSVTQGALPQRTFSYNWLRQLQSAYNPESGTVCYGSTSSGCVESYDGDGNLLLRTDANGKTTTYAYDKLNRMGSKSYSDSTPTVTFGYDTAAGTCANGGTPYDIGRLTSISTAASTSAPALPAISESMNYDPLGRVCQSQEQVGANGPYPFTYSYNLAGGLTSEVYPSGRIVSSSYDLQNRASGVSSGATTYVGSVSYASNDAPAQIAFGAVTSPWGRETVTWDPIRQQPLTVTAVTGSTTQLTLNYLYCAGQAFGQDSACTINNGNVVGAGITAPLLNVTQSFGYDGLNRLTAAGETGGSNEWNQGYSYDQWGNRAVSGSYMPNAYATPTALTQYWYTDGQGVVHRNNQWNGSATSYDAAGNQLSLPSRSFGYDAENRLVSTVQPNMSGIGYAYDGEGRRVLKTVGTSSTVYVYDAAGQLAAEYSPTGGSAGGTQYPIMDALGSTRMLLNSSGTPDKMLDYLPFGEEIGVGVGGRGPLYPSGGYPGQPDVQPLKFTGKERDAETGLDFFGSRYFSGAQGRFTSPDKPLIGQDAADPQSWNLYTYVRNNPLRYTDPDGLDYHVCVDNGNGGQNCSNLSDDQYANLYKQQNGQQGITLPGGLSGSITCGGQVCGSASYFDRSFDNSEMVSIGVGATVGGAIAGKVLDWAGSLLGRWFGGLATKAAASTATDLLAGKVVTGFSAAQEAMIQKTLTALEAAGYNTGRLQTLIRIGDAPAGYAGMSLSDGAALTDEAFSSQAMLNHTLEHELIHMNQTAQGLRTAYGPGTAQGLEHGADAQAKFPAPQQ